MCIYFLRKIDVQFRSQDTVMPLRIVTPPLVFRWGFSPRLGFGSWADYELRPLAEVVAVWAADRHVLVAHFAVLVLNLQTSPNWDEYLQFGKRSYHQHTQGHLDSLMTKLIANDDPSSSCTWFSTLQNITQSYLPMILAHF